MLSPVCISTLLASRGLPNRCACPKCREEKERQEALEYYRRDLPEPEMLPEKTGKYADGR